MPDLFIAYCPYPPPSAGARMGRIHGTAAVSVCRLRMARLAADASRRVTISGQEWSNGKPGLDCLNSDWNYLNYRFGTTAESISCVAALTDVRLTMETVINRRCAMARPLRRVRTRREGPRRILGENGDTHQP